MPALSRTHNSLINSIVAMLFYVANLLLQFLSRKVFIDYLGAELLGLNTTIVSILQFLNIAEMGVGTAVACTLYAPLRENNIGQINEIVSLQGWLYRWIAIIIAIGGVVLMCFFSSIFDENSAFPTSYIYLTFIVLLFGSLIGYVANYKQVLLSANQQEYKVQLSYKLVMLLKTIAQIIVVKYCENGYIWWLVMEVIFAVVAAVALNYAVNATFPSLQTDLSRGRELQRKHPGVTTMVSQLFFHKISTFALLQLSPIVIYTYSTLTEVTKYGNYMLVVTGLVSLLNAMFNGLNASVGNLVAENNPQKSIRIFRELFSVRFVLVSSCAIVLYMLIEPFILLWVGEEYVLSQTTLLLIVAIFYMTAMRGVVDAFLQAYGLFRDIWAPVVEATLNIGLSFLLGYYMGLDGVLLGVIISLLVIVMIWKPYFLFRQGLKMPVGIYVWLYAKHIFILCAFGIALYYVLGAISVDTISNWWSFMANGIIRITCVMVVLGILGCMVEQGMRDFICRIYRMVTRKM